MIVLKIKKHEEKFKILLIIALLSVSCFFTYYFLRIINITIVFSHFFYVPIFLACFWWKKKGLIVPIILAGLLIFFTLFSGLDDINIDYLLQGFMFVIIGTIVSILSNQISIAEEIFEESEEKYRLISENANDLISILNKEFKLEYLNEEPILKMSGFTKKELIGKSVLDFIHPNDLKQSIKKFGDVLKTGEGVIDVRTRRKDGTYRWFETRGSKFIDINGEMKYLLISRDITERKITEKKLKESEEKFRALYKGIPIPTYTWQKKGKDLILIDYNITAEEITDYEIKNYLGIKASELHKDQPTILSDLHRCVDEKNNIFQEIKYHYKSTKKDKYLSVKYGYVAPDLVLVHTEDITERKKTEQKLKESEEKLRKLNKELEQRIEERTKKLKESEEKYKELSDELELIMDHIPAMIFYKDCENNFIRVNKYIADAHKMDKKDLEGKNLFDLYTKEDAQAYWNDDLEVINNKKPKLNYEEPWDTPEGKRWALTSKIPYIDKDGHIKGVIGISTDITERMKEEKKLRESEQKYRDFVSVASHEFKTPLIPIIGIPQLLLKDTNLTEKQKDFINEIYHSGKKLNNLIDNLLDTSQIDIKTIQLDKQEIEINPLIKQCISDLSFLIKQKNHKLIKRLQEDVILNVDDKKFSRILTNLISNAIKFSPQNGKIEISTQIDNKNNFIFSIKDNGVGIEEKDKDLIFQKFGKIRGEEIAKYKLDSHGSGLGLFISKEIIKLHGGEIWFESEGKNQGTTFYFKLPRK